MEGRERETERRGRRWTEKGWLLTVMSEQNQEVRVRSRRYIYTYARAHTNAHTRRGCTCDRDVGFDNAESAKIEQLHDCCFQSRCEKCHHGSPSWLCLSTLKYQCNQLQFHVACTLYTRTNHHKSALIWVRISVGHNAVRLTQDWNRLDDWKHQQQRTWATVARNLL